MIVTHPLQFPRSISNQHTLLLAQNTVDSSSFYCNIKIVTTFFTLQSTTDPTYSNGFPNISTVILAISKFTFY